jgi:hypothetical protein
MEAETKQVALFRAKFKIQEFQDTLKVQVDGEERYRRPTVFECLRFNIGNGFVTKEDFQVLQRNPETGKAWSPWVQQYDLYPVEAETIVPTDVQSWVWKLQDKDELERIQKTWPLLFCPKSVDCMPEYVGWLLEHPLRRFDEALDNLKNELTPIFTEIKLGPQAPVLEAAVLEAAVLEAASVCDCFEEALQLLPKCVDEYSLMALVDRSANWTELGYLPLIPLLLDSRNFPRGVSRIIQEYASLDTEQLLRRESICKTLKHLITSASVDEALRRQAVANSWPPYDKGRGVEKKKRVFNFLSSPLRKGYAEPDGDQALYKASEYCPLDLILHGLEAGIVADQRIIPTLIARRDLTFQQRQMAVQNVWNTILDVEIKHPTWNKTGMLFPMTFFSQVVMLPQQSKEEAVYWLDWGLIRRFRALSSYSFLQRGLSRHSVWASLKYFGTDLLPWFLANGFPMCLQDCLQYLMDEAAGLRKIQDVFDETPRIVKEAKVALEWFRQSSDEMWPQVKPLIKGLVKHWMAPILEIFDQQASRLEEKDALDMWKCILSGAGLPCSRGREPTLEETKQLEILMAPTIVWLNRHVPLGAKKNLYACRNFFTGSWTEPVIKSILLKLGLPPQFCFSAH